MKSLLGKLSRAALEASYHIWLSRNDREWKPPLVDWKTSYRPRSTPALTAPPESQGTSSAQSLPLQKVPPSPKDSPSLVTGEEAIDFVITPLSPKEKVEESCAKGNGGSQMRREGTGVKPEKKGEEKSLGKEGDNADLEGKPFRDGV